MIVSDVLFRGYSTSSECEAVDACKRDRTNKAASRPSSQRMDSSKHYICAHDGANLRGCRPESYHSSVDHPNQDRMRETTVISEALVDIIDRYDYFSGPPSWTTHNSRPPSRSSSTRSRMVDIAHGEAAKDMSSSENLDHNSHCTSGNSGSSSHTPVSSDDKNSLYNKDDDRQVQYMDTVLRNSSSLYGTRFPQLEKSQPHNVVQPYDMLFTDDGDTSSTRELGDHDVSGRYREDEEFCSSLSSTRKILQAVDYTNESPSYDRRQEMMSWSTSSERSVSGSQIDVPSLCYSEETGTNLSYMEELSRQSLTLRDGNSTSSRSHELSRLPYVQELALHRLSQENDEIIIPDRRTLLSRKVSLGTSATTLFNPFEGDLLADLYSVNDQDISGRFVHERLDSSESTFVDTLFDSKSSGSEEEVIDRLNAEKHNINQVVDEICDSTTKERFQPAKICNQPSKRKAIHSLSDQSSDGSAGLETSNHDEYLASSKLQCFQQPIYGDRISPRQQAVVGQSAQQHEAYQSEEVGKTMDDDFKCVVNNKSLSRDKFATAVDYLLSFDVTVPAERPSDTPSSMAMPTGPVNADTAAYGALPEYRPIARYQPRFRSFYCNRDQPFHDSHYSNSLMTCSAGPVFPYSAVRIEPLRIHIADGIAEEEKTSSADEQLSRVTGRSARNQQEHLDACSWSLPHDQTYQELSPTSKSRRTRRSVDDATNEIKPAHKLRSGEEFRTTSFGSSITRISVVANSTDLSIRCNANISQGDRSDKTVRPYDWRTITDNTKSNGNVEVGADLANQSVAVNLQSNDRDVMSRQADATSWLGTESQQDLNSEGFPALECAKVDAARSSRFETIVKQEREEEFPIGSDTVVNGLQPLQESSLESSPGKSPFSGVKFACTMKNQVPIEVQKDSIRIGKSRTIAATSNSPIAGTQRRRQFQSPFASTIAKLHNYKRADSQFKPSRNSCMSTNEAAASSIARSHQSDSNRDLPNCAGSNQSWMSRFSTLSIPKHKGWTTISPGKSSRKWFQSLISRDSREPFSILEEDTGTHDLVNQAGVVGGVLDVAKDESFNRRWYDTHCDATHKL